MHSLFVKYVAGTLGAVANGMANARPAVRVSKSETKFPATGSEPKKSSMSIYVIDDHPLMRDAVSMVLRRVRPAANIVELDRLSRLSSAIGKHGAPTLFCLDLNLPDASGCSGVVPLREGFSEVPLAV